MITWKGGKPERATQCRNDERGNTASGCQKLSERRGQEREPILPKRFKEMREKEHQIKEKT